MSTLDTLGSEPLSQFFKQSREGMYITSRDGIILDANQALGDLLGYVPEALIGLDINTVLDRGENRQRYRERIESQGAVHNYPVVMRRKDGVAIPSQVSAVLWKNGDQTRGYTGIVRPSDALAGLNVPLPDPTNKPSSGRRHVTILFFDIRSSTSIAENCDPELFAGFLSDILTDIMDLVCGCHGSVNKLLGDGLLAVFGAPISQANDAQNAVDAAIRIRNYLSTFNDVRPEFLAEPIKAGIGLASGMVFAGLIGSVHRQEYTVLGDPVNLASRIQAVTKQLGETILMDQNTAQAVGKAFPCQARYRGRVRGRHEAVRLFGLEEELQACPDGE